MPKKPFKSLRVRMLELDYTQGEVAKRIHMAPSTMTAKLKGVSPFSSWEMAAIAKLLKIEPTRYCDYFFDGVGQR